MPLLLVIVIMPLNYILRNCNEGYRFTKSQEKIIVIMYYMRWFNIFLKNEKESESLVQTIRIFIQDIGMEFRIEKCTRLIMKKGK